MKKDLKYYRENAEEDYLTTPISVLRYIGEVERRKRLLDIVFNISLFIILLAFIYGVLVGRKEKQTEIENRAKQINKECYTNQDIELIIFNQIQE